MPALIDEEANIANAPDQEGISRHIILLRGKKVLLDTDLAGLYEVSIKRFNEQVKRNLERFPADFMFQLKADEYAVLRSQFATLKQGQHRKYLPYAFTEHGAIMAAMLMNSPRAISVSVHIVRAFVQLRELAASNEEFRLRLNELERKTDLLLLKHEHLERGSGQQIRQILDALRALATPPAHPAKRPIGFVTPEDRTASP
ncbi:ORF6N domain-containing protein [Massilia sp. BJB1822]|uniref:ORF6N domain-containing protein n=1 Tax=Massilia sp. BJB1822 TaxID=2744470 RepID=UPI0015940DFA|nr:ORF6N domain-containing protein [Massilia sp. BJB1822]NVE00785.1 ORF6N domain-containing protein [Massilia sp. BJB1822]